MDAGNATEAPWVTSDASTRAKFAIMTSAAPYTIDDFERYDASTKALVRLALDQTLADYPSRILALNTAARLYEVGLDGEAGAAAILSTYVHDASIDIDDIAQDFPEAVIALTRGALRMSTIDDFGQRESASSPEQSERLKNLLLAMVEDVRVVIIELADRLERLRRPSEGCPAVRKQWAHSTLDVYAPLASRLGIWQFKWELEDLAFRILEPQTYQQIARQLESRRSDRERFVIDVINELKALLAEQGIRAELSGRAKHIYGIVQKMRKKDVGFEEIFDATALRVLVPDVASCYAALGHIHGRWTPIRNEFDDYIARPKANGYQSIHTAVVGVHGRTMEVQIRTNAMHEQAEFGVAAHWRYKEGEQAGNNAAVAKAAWLRQVLQWTEDDDPVGALSAINGALLSERVYAMTPTGDILDLPDGATPLDFAYRVHTDVGHRCRGAKVNGAMVPLTHTLHSGDRVEILTARNGHPSRDWLNPNLGYLKAQRAKAKVRQWFKLQDYDQNRADGVLAFSREVSRLGVEGIDRAALATRFNLANFDDLMAALGGGDLTLGQLTGAIQQLLPREPSTEPNAQSRTQPETQARTPTSRAPDGSVNIEGVGNLLTTFARCCDPVPPQPIDGYVTRGRGVSIHRKDCSNLLRLTTEDRSRVIDVSWNPDQNHTYPAAIQVIAYDRRGLLRDVTTVVSAEHVNVVSLSSGQKRSDETVLIDLTVDVRSLTDLGRVLAQLHQITNVIEARTSSSNPQKNAPTE
ncbi:MAG: GTP pyrophosphokinase [Gammaproteobacteria bacterium]